MRFLILTQYYPPEIGAAQVRLSALAEQLVAHGHEVEVVTALPSYPASRIFPAYRGRPALHGRRRGIPIRRVWLYPATGRGLKRLAGYVTFTITCLAAMAASRRPDVVFVEIPPPTLAVPGWLMARVWGAKLVLNISDLWPDTAVALGIAGPGALLGAARRLEQFAYARADFVTAVTDGIRSALMERKGVGAERILYLPNGVDTERFQPRPRDEELAAALGVSGRSVAMLAGSIGYGAGVDVLLDAGELLADRQIDILIVGGGSDRDRLVLLAQERALANVHFLDPVPPDDVARLYSVVDIGLMTLRDSPLFEGTRPARVYPAMASGKPVIYSGAGEGARLIESAEAGIVVPPEDPRALADAIATLVADPQLAARLGGNGRRWVQQHLTWERLVGDWLDELTSRMQPSPTA